MSPTGKTGSLLRRLMNNDTEQSGRPAYEANTLWLDPIDATELQSIGN
jgi:hypothetical protein